jgi:voltage-gated potassium channel
MSGLTPARHLKIALLLVLGVVLAGTLGYMHIENLSFSDALYTAIGMMSTVGNVVRPLSEAGRTFTIFVIIIGVGSLLYTFGAGMEFLIEGHFSQAIRRHLMDRKIATLRNHYIICGFGRVGSQIAEDCWGTKKAFVVIDEHERNIQSCIQRGYLVLPDDATQDDVLREAGIEHARCILIATDDDAHNISITLSARHLNNSLFIVARANHDETKAKLKLAGANRVLFPYALAGHRMANLAFQPTVTEVFDSITSVKSMELAVKEVTLSHTSQLAGRSMVAAQTMIFKHGITMIALKKRTGSITGPQPDQIIEAGDTVIVVGMPNPLQDFEHKNSQ